MKQAYFAARNKKLKLRHRFVQDVQGNEGILLCGSDGERAMIDLSRAVIIDSEDADASPWRAFLEDVSYSTKADYQRPDLSFEQDDIPEPS